MNNSPRVYAEWLPLLDRFREGDDSALPAMQSGTIDWTSGVAERWTTQVSNAMTARLQALSRQLQTGLNRSTNTFGVSRSMIDARRALAALRALASLPCAPENVRNHLTAELERFIAQVQESLEKSARIIQDKGLILKAIRDNPLTAPAPQPEGQTNAVAQPAIRGRRVILS